MYTYLNIIITLKETHRKENVEQKIANNDFNCR